MAAPATSGTVVVDASVLINFLHIDRLQLFGALPGLRFVIPQEVEEEIERPAQRALLAAAVAAGHLAVEPSIDPAEIALAADFRRILDKGEASCLAMAQHRGWLVACDERGLFPRKTQERLGPGRLLNTAGLLIRSVRAGLLNITEADQLLVVLKANRFDLPFHSFGEVV